MLTIENLEKRFGSLRALDGVSLEVEDDCIVGLIGPNGSGKTTLFNVVSGFYEKDGGTIFLKGRVSMGCHRIRLLKRDCVAPFRSAKHRRK